jgi:hypothetical protein
MPDVSPSPTPAPSPPYNPPDQQEQNAVEHAQQVIAAGPPKPGAPPPPQPGESVSSTGIELGTTTMSEVTGGWWSVYHPQNDSIYDLQTIDDLKLSPEEWKIIKAYMAQNGQKQIDPVEARFAVRYFELWGVQAPPGYIKKIIKSGMNIYEFEDYERSKPAFRRTEIYQNDYAEAARIVAQALGFRP